MKIASVSSLKPGITNFVVSSDGNYVARGGLTIQSVFNPAAAGHTTATDAKALAARHKIRTSQLYFKDAQTGTYGDERAILPPKTNVDTQTEYISLSTKATETDQVLFSVA